MPATIDPDTTPLSADELARDAMGAGMTTDAPPLIEAEDSNPTEHDEAGPDPVETALTRLPSG